MGYDICYRKQFIKTGEGTIIPLILVGSNNCYNVSHNGSRRYERRERSWNPLFVWGLDQRIDLTPEVLKSKAGDRVNEGEQFKSGSRWVEGKDLAKFVKNGIRAALTLEEMQVKNNGSPVRVRCCVLSYLKDSPDGILSRKKHCEEDISTSQELRTFLNKAYDHMDNNPESNHYVQVQFDLEDPMPYREKRKRTRKAKPDEFWSITNNNGLYLTRLNKTSASLSYYKGDAKVFKSKEAADKYLVDKCFDQRFEKPYKSTYVTAF